MVLNDQQRLDGRLTHPTSTVKIILPKYRIFSLLFEIEDIDDFLRGRELGKLYKFPKSSVRRTMMNGCIWIINGGCELKMFC